MKVPRISSSSYSNTAPLVWSFLYGKNHGKVEIILDTAPARSVELLAQNRVDAALVPVIAAEMIEGARLIPGVCVGAKERVRSVCLITKGEDLEQVRSVSLDVSSKTSVALTKIIFREFLGFEPVWRDAEPDIGSMLAASDCALLIGDPSLALSTAGAHGMSPYRVFDLAELWNKYTDRGFVFAMWMTLTGECPIDLAAARDEGLEHLDEIAANYLHETGLAHADLLEYLSQNISYTPDDSMKEGMELFFSLARKNGLVKK